MFVTEGVNGIADASALLGVTNRRIGKSDGDSLVASPFGLGSRFRLRSGERNAPAGAAFSWG